MHPFTERSSIGRAIGAVATAVADMVGGSSGERPAPRQRALQIPDTDGGPIDGRPGVIGPSNGHGNALAGVPGTDRRRPDWMPPL